MPELPEVETTLRGISGHLTGSMVCGCEVRTDKLRWPFQENLHYTMKDQVIRDVQRRGKYLLLRCAGGTLIIHLGMSGSLRLVPCTLEPGPHDHFDLLTDTGPVLRLTDPRKFGALIWTEDDPLDHALLKEMGPEPLSDAFDPTYLMGKAHGRKRAVKQFIMDNKVVPGVGNIYANEALFTAGVRPDAAAGTLTMAQAESLVDAVKQVLRKAIDAGGTSLKDFVGAGGRPGYFQQELQVYGRGGQECTRCGAKLLEVRMDDRSTVFCENCQSA